MTLTDGYRHIVYLSDIGLNVDALLQLDEPFSETFYLYHNKLLMKN